MRRKSSLVLLGLVLALTGSLIAQEFRGRIQGVVTDPSGGAIPGAEVTLQNDATGVKVTRRRTTRVATSSTTLIREPIR